MSQADDWKRDAEKKAREKVDEDNAAKDEAQDSDAIRSPDRVRRKAEPKKEIDRVIVSDPEVQGATPARTRLKVRIVYKDGTEECHYYYPDADELWPTAC